jgi:glucokinase
MMETITAGVDIGGTHATVCLVDKAKGEFLKPTYARVHIDPFMEKDAVIQTWAGLIRECFGKAQLPVGQIGMAMPGPFDYERGISYIKGLNKYECLFGENVKYLLAEALGIQPAQISMINDASAYLLGELSAGAGKGYQNVVGITLGTGLGSASFYNNTLEDGDLYAFAYAGGKAEDYVSANWLLRSYEERRGEKLAGVKELAAKVVEDAIAQQLFEEYGRNLGEVLVLRYREQSPEVVIIGGNIAKALDLFIPSAMASLQSAGLNVALKPALLGEDAALMGACRVV